MSLDLFDDFFARALLGGVGVALAIGPLGCFVVWRRMAYFGASISHSALLGVVLGVAVGMDVNAGIAIVCVALAVLLLLLQRQRHLATDTLLGILAHGALALGLVALSFIEALRVDLMGYLFGDILAVTTRDLVWIYGGGAAVLAATAVLWRPLLAITVHEELARAEGVRVELVRIAFTLLIALTVAISMKIIGLLLIVSLLIIPAATARRLSRSPEQMAILSSVVGAAAVVGGLYGSFAWDTPSGPSIVVAALGLFVVGLVAGSIVNGWAARAVDSTQAGH
jgi:zinc transport system permease protein